MDTPLSYSSLLTQADEHHARYRAEADKRDAAFYGPGKLMRTVMRPIEQRLPPQWDAFFQALQNNGVSQMRSFPQTQTMGATNQLGAIGGAAPMQHPSMVPFADLEGGPQLNLDAPRVNMDRRPEPKKAKR